MRQRLTRFLAAIALYSASLAYSHPTHHHAKEIYKQVHPSIYPVYVVSQKNNRLNSIGSSVAVTPSTLVTNCHVLQGNSRFVITSGGQQYPATVLRGSKYRDVCLLKVKGLTLHDVPIRLSETVPVGEPVYAIGNPKGSIKSITTGIISNKKPVEGGNWLQTDATISFGSSGGGLFDDEGRLIGITTALQGRFGYALPTEWVLAQLNSTTVVKNSQAFFASDSSPMMRKLAQTKSVTLYRYMHGNCFILAKGKDRHGKNRGTLFWSPSEPGMILLFPTTHRVKNVIKIVEQVLKNGASKKQNMHRARSWIRLGKKNRVLYSLQEKGGIYPLLISNIGNNVFHSIGSKGEVTVRFRDGFFPKGKVHYSLQDVPNALLQNKAQCKQLGFSIND